MVSASAVFLAAYMVLGLALAYLLITKRAPRAWRNLWLAIHILLRIAAQISSVGFGVEGFRNVNWMYAYFVLGVEGTTSIIICWARFFIAFQMKVWGNSYLEPRRPEGMSTWRYQLYSLSSPVVFGHIFIITANVLLVVGGVVSLNNHTDTDDEYHPTKNTLGLRVAAYALFMSIVQSIAAYTIVEIRKCVSHGLKHTCLKIVLLVWPFLTIRVIFGILSCTVDIFDLNNPALYTSLDGFPSSYVAAESCLGIFPEFASATFLVISNSLWNHIQPAQDIEQTQTELQTDLLKADTPK
ncbi:hypothetical protein CANCADRAFT_29057 [Tortispora caseinolytica NRRL Y-17796]|uniref:Uncharacterized protein n=1 Tax=Tortispora caseinolytica NRRL Y-17796 TaxID=767744 RepID=A0A1E4TAF7_9ASCO|nr:hypothetical protein CANCADRAFT_29057 [Tortispora caseinolytica NRRL Y-17796]